MLLPILCLLHLYLHPRRQCIIRLFDFGHLRWGKRRGDTKVHQEQFWPRDRGKGLQDRRWEKVGLKFKCRRETSNLTLCARQWLDQTVHLLLRSVLVSAFAHTHFYPPFDSDTQSMSTIPPVSLFYSWGTKAQYSEVMYSTSQTTLSQGQGSVFQLCTHYVSPGFQALPKRPQRIRIISSGHISSIFEFNSSVEFSYLL